MTDILQSMADITLSEHQNYNKINNNTTATPTTPINNNTTSVTTTQQRRLQHSPHHNTVINGIEIIVDAYEKRLENTLREYYVYRIHKTIFNTDDGTDNTHVIIYRRYSDFEYLYNRLYNLYNSQGYLIPPIPEKDILPHYVEKVQYAVSNTINSALTHITHKHNNNNNDIDDEHNNSHNNHELHIRSRQNSLNMFLQRVLRHNVLSKSDDLHNFLSDNEQLWLEYRNKTDHSINDNNDSNNSPVINTSALTTQASNAITQTTASIYSWMNTGYNALQNKLIHHTSKNNNQSNFTDTDLTDSDDINCNDILNYAINLENNLYNMYNTLVKLQQTTHTYADSLLEYCDITTTIASNELRQPNQQPITESLMKQISYTSQQISNEQYIQSENDLYELKERIKDYIRLCNAIKLMVNNRQIIKNDNQNDITINNNNVINTNQTISNMKLTQITDNIINEFNQFKINKQNDFIDIMLRYYKLTHDSCNKQLQIYSSTIDKLNQLYENNIEQYQHR